jgi:hypothetical protein
MLATLPSDAFLVTPGLKVTLPLIRIDKQSVVARYAAVYLVMNLSARRGSLKMLSIYVV